MVYISLITVLLLPLATLDLLLASPIPSNTNLTKRTSNRWVWNIDPDVTNPPCGIAMHLNINLKSTPKDPNAVTNAEKCNNIKNYFTGRPDNPDIELILKCNGWDPIKDEGMADGKLIFTYKAFDQSSAVDWTVEGKQELVGNLRVSDRVYGYIADVNVTIGIDVDTRNNDATINKFAKYQYIYCN